MSTFDYAKLAKTALKQLKRFGQPITLTRKVSGNYDRNASSTPVTIQTENAFGFPTTYEDNEIDGTAILRSDTKLFISAVGITKPAMNDVAVLANGTKLTIKNVDEIDMANSPIIYICQGRK